MNTTSDMTLTGPKAAASATSHSDLKPLATKAINQRDRKKSPRNAQLEIIGGNDPRFKLLPVPNGVYEFRTSQGSRCLPVKTISPNLYGGFAELSDGKIMLAYADHTGIQQGDPVQSKFVTSRDSGKSWSKEKGLSLKMGIYGMIRLQNGKLAVYGETHYGGSLLNESNLTYFSTSPDEGKTWTGPIRVPTYPSFFTYLRSMVQLSTGRILLCGYWEGLDAKLPDRLGLTDTYPYTQYSWGIWRGRIFHCEGHRGQEMTINMVYYTDDEGKTWKRCPDGIFAWFDRQGVPNGEDGIMEVAEPNIAECKDGSLLMIMRSKTGRLLESRSLDGGETWQSVLPTELAASQTSPQLIRLPDSGDLLCVWNQISGEEIRRGFQRGRLSAAISKDDGRTWEKFKTLERQEGMDVVDRIAPEFPIPRRLVGRAYFGTLPDGFVHFSQPSIDVAGGKVFVRYGRMWPVEKEGSEPLYREKTPDVWPDRALDGAAMAGCEIITRVYPISYFYQSLAPGRPRVPTRKTESSRRRGH